MNLILPTIGIVLLLSGANAAEGDQSDAGRAKQALSKSQTEALAVASKAIEADPKNPRGYVARARLYEEHNDLAKALADYDQGLKIDPAMAELWQNRGVIQFKLAHIDESISDFDQFIKLRPGQAPYHWQRGICYYYAGRFEDGRKQFELHQTVNPNDVENAVWHFLCIARAEGLEKARAALIPIREDGRVPMMKIHALFAGKIQPEDVMAAVRAGEPAGPELRLRHFYAHLYLGLYSEALGKEAEARDHITKAAREYGGHDYMSEVARVHLILRSGKR